MAQAKAAVPSAVGAVAGVMAKSNQIATSQAEAILWSTRSRWAQGLKPPDLYEWISNCYMMRCDDDYLYGGCYLHGPYLPEKTIASVRADFQVFCLLAVRRGCLPSPWDWSAFLKVAGKFAGFGFEKSDAQKRWGSENVFDVAAGGRSLRFTAELIYGNSMQQMDLSKDHKKLLEAIESDDADALIEEIGGAAAWEVFTEVLRNHVKY